MGWKGTIRTIGAATRAAERDAKRRQKELEKQQKMYEKMQELEQAAYEVEVYENHIEIIQSMHKECNSPIDWNEILNSEQPEKPSNENKKEEKAKSMLENYKPSIFDLLFRRTEKKKLSLTQKIKDSKLEDEKDFLNAYSNWEKEVKDWQEDVNLAKKLLNGEKEAKEKVINKFEPFSEISNLGSSLSIEISDKGFVEATINVHGTEIVPIESKSLLKSGKLSVKNMPKGKFNEIYQDYVCSCVLRIANELFSIIPDNLLLITAIDDLLNEATGHLEKTPIISVAISRNTINTLNLETIDPSESMTNFVHNMSFKKTKGFEKVERVNIEELVN